VPGFLYLHLPDQKLLIRLNKIFGLKLNISKIQNSASSKKFSCNLSRNGEPAILYSRHIVSFCPKIYLQMKHNFVEINRLKTTPYSYVNFYAGWAKGKNVSQ